MKRITQPNPSGKNYRVPINRDSEIRINSIKGTVAIFGTTVDRLGEYEDLGTIEELRELKKAHPFKQK